MIRYLAAGAALLLALSGCGGGGASVPGGGGTVPPPGTICPAIVPAVPPVVLAYPGSGSTHVATAIGTLYFQSTSTGSGAIGTGIPALTPAGSTTAIFGTVLAAATMLPPGQTGALSSYETSNVATLAANTSYTISLVSAQSGCTVATGLGTFST